MKYFLGCLSIALLTAFVSHNTAVAKPPKDWKAKSLSNREEAEWIKAVKQHRTADRAVVWQVLQHAEKMRPNKFKIGSVSVGYNGASGDPEGVGIEYWVGTKRLEGDAFTDLWYDVKRDGSNLLVALPKSDYEDRIVNAVEGGGDKFLIYIDRMYDETCIDVETKQKLC